VIHQPQPEETKVDRLGLPPRPSEPIPVVNQQPKLIEDTQHPVADEYEADMPRLEYTTICNADFLPLVCNEFITEYLDKHNHKTNIDRGDAIDLTRNLCWWLNEHNLTCAYISMNNKSN